MDRKPTLTSRLVALAWVRGSINNRSVRALLGGCPATRAGTAICQAKDAGHLVETKSTLPKAWGLSAERAEAIASMPNLLALRTEAEQLAQVVQRVSEAQAAMREQRTEQRKAFLAAAATHNRQARREARVAGQRAAKVARAAAQAAAKAGAVGTAKRQPSPAPAAAAPAQDPKGLLARAPDAPASIAPILVRGGWLAPSDGPYIRPDGLAHLGAPSRQGDALVAHRPPRSAP